MFQTKCTLDVGMSRLLKVETHSMPGQFLKVEYLKTELAEDTDTPTIIKVTSHTLRIMINLSVSGIFI